MGQVRKVLHPLVDLGAEPADLALGDAVHAHSADQVVHRAGRDALDVGFLDDRGQRPLSGAPGLQEGGEVAAAPELRNAQFHSTGAGVSVALAVTDALVDAALAALAMGGRRSGRPPPAPSDARRRSRSSRAEVRRRRIFPNGHAAPSYRRSSWGFPGLRLKVSTTQTLPRITAVTARTGRSATLRRGLRYAPRARPRLHHHPEHDPLGGSAKGPQTSNCRAEPVP